MQISVFFSKLSLSSLKNPHSGIPVEKENRKENYHQIVKKYVNNKLESAPLE